ncbi:hypothetical protein [Mesorhizobium sp. B2-6-2]|uniref:hypothetical protein n=1 Tax=Mesorhizobium sp. B2-6-2 TaxID=2589915 RepID=UPI0015E47749|nr:hypothetical protein [Mesorhizobium sp. B2-6-2]
MHPARLSLLLAGVFAIVGLPANAATLRSDTAVVSARSAAAFFAARHAASSKNGLLIASAEAPVRSRSAWPDATNTGVPPGTILTDYKDECVITENNFVVNGKTVNCSLSIQASNVIIKNSKINGQVILDTDRPGSKLWSFSMFDSEVDAGTIQQSAVGWGNLQVLRSNIHGGVTSVQCDETSSSCLVQDSYLHGQYMPEGQDWHLGGFLSDGGRNITLRHNYIICDHPVNSVGGGCTGDVNLIPNFDAIKGALIENNFFGANTYLSYCTYGGEKKNSKFPHSYNVIYKNNILMRGANKKCGAYGPVTNFNATNTGNLWLDNFWDDGTVVHPAN